MNRYFIFVLIIMVFCFSNACEEDNDNENSNIYEYIDNTEWGIYPVGVTTRVFVDESRDAKYTDKEGDFRTLVTEIWYPAVDEAANLDCEYFFDTYAPYQEDVLPFVSELADVPLEEMNQDICNQQTNSHRDAQFSGLLENCPVVIFSHGNSGIRIQSIYITEWLASHGYIVISPDHTGSAMVTIIDGEMISYNEGTLWDFETRASDISFLLDEISELNENDPEGFFTGKINTDRVACMGHSLGGVTTVKAIVEDDRLKAGIPIAGAILAEETITKPMMYLYGSSDVMAEMLTEFIIDNYNEKTSSTKFLLEHIGAGHFSFSNMCDLMPDIGEGCTAVPGEYVSIETAWQIGRDYITAFLGYILKERSEYLDYLQTNHYPEYLGYDKVIY